MLNPIRSKELQKTKVLSIETEFPIQKWREELEFLQQEAHFYQELMRIGLRNASVQTRKQLSKLLDRLLHLTQGHLREMFSLLQAITDGEEGDNEITRSYFHKQEAFQQEFRRLKSQTFPIIDDLQPITIW